MGSIYYVMVEVMVCLVRGCRDAPGRSLQETNCHHRKEAKRMDFLSQLEANPICN